MTVARELAEFLTRTASSDLLRQAVEHAAMLIASTLASAALGTGLESSGIIRDLARERGGRPDASLWFHPGDKLPMADAAQVNAVASDAAASDDSDLRNIVHAGTTLAATTLAVGERTGARGEEMLAAIVLGYEAAGRIGEAITPGFRSRGFHGCLVSIFGGAAGVSVTRDLGETWDIVTDMAIKLVPGGHPHHALAEAAANAARDGNIAPEEIDSITLSRPGVTALAGPLHPTDLIGMAHSPAYFLAAGAADREFSWLHATAAKISDPVIHRLIDKVRVGAPPADNTALYRQGATVTIRSTDGRISTSAVYAPKGAGMDGIAWADIDAKYRTLVPHSGLRADQIEASLAVIHDFRHVTNASALTNLLYPRGVEGA